VEVLIILSDENRVQCELNLALISLVQKNIQKIFLILIAGDPIGNKTKITYGKLDVGVFQKEGHNGGNVYKIQIAESETGPWTDL
jgi:hypothetical protein